MKKLGPRLARRWVSLYTRGLPAGQRTARREEIESDLWEELQEGAASRQILTRVVRGAGADVSWRMARRGRVQVMNRSMSGEALHISGRSSRIGKAGRPRGPGVAYTALSLVLLAIVASVALSSRQTPPPTIAEFAPQAVEQITDSSADVAGSRGGTSAETPMLDKEATGNDLSQQTIDVARVRQCVGDPPRQIEDPQSPPCVPYWTGDNGGATSRGVTRDEIRVVYPLERDDPYNPHEAVRRHLLERFFNKRFEFYGRQVHLIPRRVPQEYGPGDRAAAQAAYEQDRAFASTFPFCDACQPYFEELARLGIVGAYFDPIFPEPYLESRRPYLWSYPMATDRLFTMTGNWYCARFAGRNALHAGDPLFQLSRRKPGIIRFDAGFENASTESMTTQFAQCGSRTDAVVHGSWRDPNAQVFMENAVLQMKTSGATSVICLCDIAGVGDAMRAATNQGYFPEWLLNDYHTNWYPGWVRTLSAPEQAEHLMLLLAHPMQRPYADHPANWATQEAGQTDQASKGGGGADGGLTSIDQVDFDGIYQSFLLLASGFQMAGPHLTPETFERGLHRTRFPNPPHRIMAGDVGFTDGDHSMTDDAAEIWWSNTAQSPYGEGVGAFCYVDHGARRRMGTFPTDDPFFKGECDNGTS